MKSADRREQKPWPLDLFSSSSWGSSTPTFADEDEDYPDRLISCPDLSSNVRFQDTPAGGAVCPRLFASSLSRNLCQQSTSHTVVVGRL